MNSRRDFIKKTSLATAALTTLPITSLADSLDTKDNWLENWDHLPEGEHWTDIIHELNTPNVKFRQKIGNIYIDFLNNSQKPNTEIEIYAKEMPPAYGLWFGLDINTNRESFLSDEWKEKDKCFRNYLRCVKHQKTLSIGYAYDIDPDGLIMNIHYNDDIYCYNEKENIKSSWLWTYPDKVELTFINNEETI